MAYKNNNNIDSNHNNNNQKPLSQEVGEDEVDHQYEQEMFTHTYSEDFRDDYDKADRFTDDNAHREKFTDNYR